MENMGMGMEMGPWMRMRMGMGMGMGTPPGGFGHMPGGPSQGGLLQMTQPMPVAAQFGQTPNYNAGWHPGLTATASSATSGAASGTAGAAAGAVPAPSSVQRRPFNNERGKRKPSEPVGVGAYECQLCGKYWVSTEVGSPATTRLPPVSEARLPSPIPDTRSTPEGATITHFCPTQNKSLCPFFYFFWEFRPSRRP